LSTLKVFLQVDTHQALRGERLTLSWWSWSSSAGRVRWRCGLFEWIQTTRMERDHQRVARRTRKPSPRCVASLSHWCHCQPTTTLQSNNTNRQTLHSTETNDRLDDSTDVDRARLCEDRPSCIVV